MSFTQFKAGLFAVWSMSVVVICASIFLMSKLHTWQKVPLPSYINWLGICQHEGYMCVCVIDCRDTIQSYRQCKSLPDDRHGYVTFCGHQSCFGQVWMWPYRHLLRKKMLKDIIRDNMNCNSNKCSFSKPVFTVNCRDEFTVVC